MKCICTDIFVSHHNLIIPVRNYYYQCTSYPIYLNKNIILAWSNQSISIGGWQFPREIALHFQCTKADYPQNIPSRNFDRNISTSFEITLRQSTRQELACQESLSCLKSI